MRQHLRKAFAESQRLTHTRARTKVKDKARGHAVESMAKGVRNLASVHVCSCANEVLHPMGMSLVWATCGFQCTVELGGNLESS